MSADEEVQDRVAKVLEAASEPSYLSEIARKLDMVYPDQGWSVKQVSQAVSLLQQEDRLDVYDVGYDQNDGQVEGSPKYSLDPEGGVVEQTEWETYTLVHNSGQDIDEIDDELNEILNHTLSVEDKVDVINNLSGVGNDISKKAEIIMQDAMRRQFREYDTVYWESYNDPGIDFYVVDGDRRGFGLAIEISTRYENPVDGPYLDSKQEKAMDKDLDLVIMAPSFTNTLRERFEDAGDDKWHSEPEGQITHLHRVPNDRPEVYRPFAFSADVDDDSMADGYPVIVPDSDRVRRKLGDTGHIGDRYPVMVDNAESFLASMDSVNRRYNVVTESEYRLQIREALEPLLRDFAKPYKIEQYLIDTYWDKGLSTSDIGNRTGVTGRTIRRWLSDQHWDIITRGANTPISDETVEVWKRMYRGEEPFEDEKTGYEIQFLFNRNPYYTLEDWEQWVNLSEQEKADIMAQRPGTDDGITYTIMLGSDSRLFPSYSFIINKLRDEGVDIREGFFGDSGLVYPTGSALEFMLNRQYNTFGTGTDPGQRDVVKMRSGLEVDVAEWFSEVEVPFGYEPFQVPSTFDTVSDSPNSLSEIINEADRDEVLATWRRIYNKHNLSDEGDVGVEEGLERFQRQFLVPDFALYDGASMTTKDADWEGWTDWSHIIEVAGPYSVGMIRDWTDWYRVSGVAYKELALKVMGLWEDSYFIVPDSQAIPDEVRNDSHFIVINPTQVDSGLDDVQRRLGL